MSREQSLNNRNPGVILLEENRTQPQDCGYKCGALPQCAPLAAGLVPAQQKAVPKYASEKALARGTLFPGLDLPLGNMVNDDTADVPLAELMAIHFAAHDLSLYLDTHAGDKEAFETYKDLLKLCREAEKRYEAQYGPIVKSDLENEQRFNWLKGPWPWEYTGKAVN